MHILHVTPLYHPSPGGAERHCREVAERLAARGHQVTVLTANARTHRELLQGVPPSLPARETMHEVQVRRLPADDDAAYRLLAGWSRLRGGYRSVSALFTPSGLDMLLLNRPRNRGFLQATLGARADVVVTWNWVMAAAYHAYLARSLRRFRLVGIPLFHTAEAWAQRPIYDRMLRACDGLIVNTEHETEFIRARVPGAGPILPVGPGIDPNTFRGADGPRFRRQHGLGDRPLVGFLGRICPGKGVPVLLAAMQAVWARQPEAGLVLAGYRSFDGLPPDHLLAGLTPEERARVLFLPDFPEAEKADLYEALDVFAMPSVAESFGIAYLEAWMCRKPVIGSDIGAIRYVIDDGVDGLRVDPQDVPGLARSIDALLADPARRARLGDAGYRKTLEHYTWDAVTTRVERFLQAIATDACAPVPAPGPAAAGVPEGAPGPGAMARGGMRR